MVVPPSLNPAGDPEYTTIAASSGTPTTRSVYPSPSMSPAAARASPFASKDTVASSSNPDVVPRYTRTTPLVKVARSAYPSRSKSPIATARGASVDEAPYTSQSAVV